MKKISVIIPVYNVSIYLEKCLNSVINQTLREIEIICVNDGSIDNSLAILREYEKKDNRITVIDQKNSGPGKARNSGLKVASADFIMFVDPDDWIESETCQIMYEYISQNNYDIVQANFNLYYQIHSHTKAADEEYFNTKKTKSHNIKPNEFNISNNSVCGKLYKKEIINKYNIIFPEGVLYEDACFSMCYIACAYNIIFIENKLYNYVRREGSIMNNSVKKQNPKGLDHAKMFIYVYDFLIKNNLFTIRETHFWTLFYYNIWHSREYVPNLMYKQIYIITSDFLKDKKIEHLQNELPEHIYDTLIKFKQKKYREFITPTSFLEKLVFFIFSIRKTRYGKNIYLFNIPIIKITKESTRILFIKIVKMKNGKKVFKVRLLLIPNFLRKKLRKKLINY